MVVDINELTVDQIDKIEDILEESIAVVINDPTRRQGKIMRTIAFVLCSEDDPDFTMEQAGKKIVLFKAPEVPPTKATD
jgi:hypothetical protein